MVKVNVVRWGAGAVGSASMLALGTMPAGCVADATEEGADADESAYTVANAGSGTFSLDYAYGTGSGFAFAAHDGNDEFVRVGERMTLKVPAYFLWSKLYPNDAMPSDVARLKQLRASVKVTFLDKGKPARTRTLALSSWTGTQSWDLAGASASFTIPSRTDAAAFDVTITDAAQSSARVVVPATDFMQVPVLGGELPQKNALFDTAGPNKRTRVVEGGQPVRGASTRIAFTDWRANTVVDSYGIDRQIGTATGFGRFGSFEMPIMGDLQFEVSYGYGFDGAWNQGEIALVANDKSILMPAFGRTAYEAMLDVPASARALDMYFHVKAYLVVDYSRYTNIRSQRYQQGDRILVREVWDNPSGPSSNYHFDLEAR